MSDTTAFHAAFAETTSIVDGLVAGLTPDHREAPTPCKDFTVHQLVNHMVAGGQMISAMWSGQEPVDFGHDWLAETGPVAGWAGARDAMRAVFTDEQLTTIQPGPFGEVPGSQFASVIVADHLIHAWDLARATGQSISPSAETVAFADIAIRSVMQPEARNGDTFEDEKPVDAGADPLTKLAAFSGRDV